ncbi:MAG: hypothetical protein ACRDT2_01245 [Natronosporangium sp.]
MSDSFFTFVGNLVHRTGRTTGHRIGVVSEVCEPFGVQETNIVLLCQEEATMVSAGSDSGAPVFELTHDPSNNDVRAVGGARQLRDLSEALGEPVVGLVPADLVRELAAGGAGVDQQQLGAGHL